MLNKTITAITLGATVLLLHVGTTYAGQNPGGGNSRNPGQQDGNTSHSGSNGPGSLNFGCGGMCHGRSGEDSSGQDRASINSTEHGGPNQAGDKSKNGGMRDK